MYAFYQTKAPFLQVIQWKYSTYRGNCNAHIAKSKELTSGGKREKSAISPLLSAFLRKSHRRA